MVDFEFAEENYAAIDLAWACNLWLQGKRLRRQFFKKYLECMGDDYSDESVDEVILEA